jgi:hypothetical protein
VDAVHVPSVGECWLGEGRNRRIHHGADIFATPFHLAAVRAQTLGLGAARVWGNDVAGGTHPVPAASSCYHRQNASRRRYGRALVVAVGELLWPVRAGPAVPSFRRPRCGSPRAVTQCLDGRRRAPDRVTGGLEATGVDALADPARADKPFAFGDGPASIGSSIRIRRRPTAFFVS